LGRLDLALPECKVAIEYDGRWHLTPAQERHDKKRRKRIEDEGWAFVIVKADDLANDFEGVVAAVTAARTSQLAR
jgi:very-short-patch-repair endonuclease